MSLAAFAARPSPKEAPRFLREGLPVDRAVLEDFLCLGLRDH